LRHTTVGRTPLDEGPARRRDLYLTTHNTHKRQTSMSTVGFKPTILVSERPKTHALDRTATGIGVGKSYITKKALYQYSSTFPLTYWVYVSANPQKSSKKIGYAVMRVDQSMALRMGVIIHVKLTFTVCDHLWKNSDNRSLVYKITFLLLLIDLHATNEKTTKLYLSRRSWMSKDCCMVNFYVYNFRSYLSRKDYVTLIKLIHLIMCKIITMFILRNASI
jgi:hypothetical protein